VPNCTEEKAEHESHEANFGSIKFMDGRANNWDEADSQENNWNLVSVNDYY